MKTYLLDDIKEAQASTRTSKFLKWWHSNVQCPHRVYEQIHPPPALDDHPKGKPSFSHCRLYQEGRDGELAKFKCTGCGKTKYISIEAFRCLEESN